MVAHDYKPIDFLCQMSLYIYCIHFSFQSLQSKNFTDFHSCKFGFPVRKGEFADSIITADVLDDSACFMLLKNGDYLRLCKS